MASLTVLSSSSPWLSCGGGRHACIPSASLTFLAGSTRRSSVSLNAGSNPIPHSGLLHCSFIPSSSSSSSFSSSFSFPSSFSGLSLGLNLSYGIGVGREKARSLVVRAGKFALCQTKRNRS
ncbi:hypothetical protein F2P56_019767 [Juglans regia]|uniref:Uncharacterized protein n=1 Tax=Juglans regia TaxID=51240 RepID=A0A833UWU3_JUGRE|nr:hypothetical protein F2P56_019767 [Juglans regia]